MNRIWNWLNRIWNWMNQIELKPEHGAGGTEPNGLG